MAHTYTNLVTHVIFSTKDRQPSIRCEFSAALYAYMGGIVRELGGKAAIINGTQDHVHLLVRMPPTIATSDALRILKTNSSRWARETQLMAHSFGWQTGYAAFSVSESNVESVLKYIREQEDHHRKISFQEELLSLFRKHRIPYDPRYVWE